MKTIIFLLFFCFAITGCRKEAIELLVQETNSNATYNLTAIQFINDSVGFATGGTRYTIGVFLKTVDGGKTWTSNDSILPSNGYSIYFFSPNEGFIGGNYSWWAYTNDGGQNFTSRLSNLLPHNGICFKNRNYGLAVGGAGYGEGFIKYTTDGGSSWAITNYQNNFRAVQYADSNTAYASGYGVIYKSTNGGQNFYALDVQGDFFVAMDFPSANTGFFAGYQGMIAKTSDGGNSFKKVHNGNTFFEKREHFEGIDFWDDNTGYVVGDGGEMLHTTNGGESWKKVRSFTDVNLRDIHLFSATSGIIVGDNGKIFLFKE